MGVTDGNEVVQRGYMFGGKAAGRCAEEGLDACVAATRATLKMQSDTAGMLRAA